MDTLRLRAIAGDGSTSRLNAPSFAAMSGEAAHQGERRGPYLKILLSFDIDGTLETGDPPGPVTLEMVRKAQELGCIIGSASDRALNAQKNMWARAEIEVDFVAQKHLLTDIRERFEADYYLHMGDRELDRQFALEAGFEFMWMDDVPASEPWNGKPE